MAGSMFQPDRSVLDGETADVYFSRTMDILKSQGLNPIATMEFFSGRDGIFCGIEETKALLKQVLTKVACEVWALDEGSSITARETVLRVTAPYQNYGLYETAIDGMLSSSSGWATAARECVEAAQGIPVISFGARHIHPSVAGIMDYSAVVGGCAGCSTVIGGRLSGLPPSGTMPHTLILISGDTVKAAKAFDDIMPEEVPRIVLVDTFKDEAEESLRVAMELKDRLKSVRLDTPGERGGVTIGLVKEVRARLDLAGFNHVGIFISGGLNPERIRQFVADNTPVAGFGVGSYISGASPIDFTADIHELDGRPVAKRGRIPGISNNSRLKRVL